MQTGQSYDDERRRLLTLTAAGVSAAALGRSRRVNAPTRPTRSAGSRRAARSRCSTTIPTGSPRSSAISATSRRPWSPGRRTRPRRSSWSTRNRRTWAIPRPACSRWRSSRASRSSRCSKWAAATCSTSPSARARSRRASRISRARRSCSAAPAGSRSAIRCSYAAGVDIKKIKYVDAGWPTWGTALKAGKGDAALSWEGLRAQWKGQGLDFDYILGKDYSKLPANSFVIRKADFEDAAKKKLYARYLQGWAAGLEFGKQNPRAATQIVMEQFPGLASQMTPAVATESMLRTRQRLRRPHGRAQEVGLPPDLELAALLRHRPQDRPDHADFKTEDVCKNDLIDEANAFDAAKVKADADGFALSADYKAVDVAAIKAAL